MSFEAIVDDGHPMITIDHLEPLALMSETNIHLDQPFYLFTKTWKYDGSVFGTEVAGGAQTE